MNPPTRTEAPTNRKAMERELGHVEFIATLMADKEDFSRRGMMDQAEIKGWEIPAYLHHQGS